GSRGPPDGLARVPGRPLWEHPRQDGVVVAVVVEAHELLDVARLLTLLPVLLPRATPVVHVAGLLRAAQRLRIGPCHHEDVVRPRVLGDDRDEIHRISSPFARSISFTAFTVVVP